MKNYGLAVIAAAMLFGGAATANAQTAGEWVLGNYKKAGYWFPGVIEKVQGGQITIRYDDGDRETVAFRDARPYDWKTGGKVECNFQGQGKWYAGRITALSGDKISIAYDDGDKENTRTGRCRSR